MKQNMNQTLEERLDRVLAENSLTENDPVNHPSHYTDGIEVIDDSRRVPCTVYDG